MDIKKLRKNSYWCKFINYNYKKYCNDYINLNESHYPHYNDFYKIHYNHNNYKFNDLYCYENYQKFLYESLKTHDIKSFTYKLYDKCPSIRDYYFNYNDNKELEDYVYIMCYDDSEEEKIKQICTLYGYYIVNKELLENNQDVIYCIEATFGYTDKTNYVYEACNGILYHITDSRFVNKILKYGLIPKHLDKRVTHPGRIYCLTTDNKNDIKILAKELHPNRRYTILKIDLNLYQEQLQFYQDPAYSKYGVFTCENIPPYCIQIINI